MQVTSNEFALLAALASGAPSSRRALAARTGLSSGSVGRTLKAVEDAGLVRDGALTQTGFDALEPYRVRNAVVMAAGLSSRCAPISYEKPKGLLRVRGERLIERQIRQLREAGIEDVTVVVGYKKEEFFYLEDAFGVDIVVNEDFDGTDINVQCGSTHLGPVRDLVAEIGADVGIAHDGDADRVMLVDAHGNEIDGDVVEAVCAIDLHKRGLLPGGTAVSTVMCNLGLTHALRDAGIELIQTKVGDRYVLEAMREGGFVLGGEQSGHMIFLEHNSTGDGLVTALQFLAACQRAGSTIEDAASVMTRFPQTLINVRVGDKHAVDGNAAVQAAVEAAEAELGDSGRVLLRPSGTEPVVRVMVEAASAEEAERHARAIADVVAEIAANKLVQGVTISGGEPFEQAAACAALARQVRELGLDVWTYSGYRYEQLAEGIPDPAARDLLDQTDVLVDGPFVQAQHSYQLPWRGSHNQRLIDVPATRARGRIVLWETHEDFPVKPPSW